MAEIEKHIEDKRTELIWALHRQDYTSRQLAYIFGMSRSNVHKITSKMDPKWQSPWKKNTQ